MRTRTTNSKSKAAAVTGTTAKKKTTPKKAPAVATSVKAELPPELPKERAQTGSGGWTRLNEVKMTGFENVVDSIFSFNPDEAYAEVMASLELSQSASRTDYGDLVNALDAAEETARKALQLVANAKVAGENYQNDIKVLESQLHEQAVEELMAKFNDPDDDTVTKKPTIADIEAYKIANYHDEWHAMKERTSKSKRTVEYLEGLASVSAQRARDLRQMVASCRGAG